MKKIINLKQVKGKDLAEIIKKQMEADYSFPAHVDVRHLELAVRSLNLQRTS